MYTYQGKYHYESSAEVQTATVSFANNKLQIGLKDEHGNPRNVLWFWEKIVIEKINGSECFLGYDGYPRQTLIVLSSEFAEELEKRRKVFGKPTSNNRAVNAILVISGVMLVLGLALYLWLIPYLAGKAAEAIPVSYEQELGDKLYRSLIAEYKVEPEKTKLANEFFKQMKVPTAYDIRITVVKDDQLNAFAMPGGNIVVYDKLIREMKGPEELAALLAHEFSHVQLRHTTKTMFRSMGTYVMLSLVFGDLTGVGGVMLENAHSLKNLQYSRSLEKEADLNGLELLHARHINGNGYVNLFNTLKKENGLAPSEWMSSHPDLDNRINYIKSNEHYQPGATTDTTLTRLFAALQSDEKTW